MLTYNTLCMHKMSYQANHTCKTAPYRWHHQGLAEVAYVKSSEAKRVHIKQLNLIFLGSSGNWTKMAPLHKP